MSGQFYAASPGVLASQIDAALRAAPRASAPPTPPKLLIVPHAGHVYSGGVAAAAYTLLESGPGRARRIVLLGPSHRVALRGVAIPSVDRFATPLGEVPLDRPALDGLLCLAFVTVNDAAHAREHSLEVQLPFLQRVLGTFILVPLVVGEADPGEVADALERLWGGDETLIVVSSDLSHFLDYTQARRRDAQTLRRILARDARLDPQDACGAHPVNGALLAAIRHGLKPELISSCNSGDITGDHDRVVGYASLAFWPESDHRSDRQTGSAMTRGADGLGPALLSRARNAIASRLGLSLRDEPCHPALHEPGATFVTLHRQGRLRGCIGRLIPGEDSLDFDVRRNAVRAAFEDPRFRPLTAAEWSGLEVEVSLLEPPRPLTVETEAEALACLRPGLDGVILAWRQHRGTFLPQVWEQLPDGREFLSALRRKAGLPEDFWAEDVELATYGVQLFRETRRIEP